MRVSLRSEKGGSTEGEARVREWSPRERKLRALRVLGGAWALALAAVFLPLLHFFLVPLLALAGPVLAYWIHGQARTVTGGEGACPACGKSFRISRASARWPLQDTCGECHERVEVRPLS